MKRIICFLEIIFLMTLLLTGCHTGNKEIIETEPASETETETKTKEETEPEVQQESSQKPKENKPVTEVMDGVRLQVKGGYLLHISDDDSALFVDCISGTSETYEFSESVSMLCTDQMYIYYIHCDEQDNYEIYSMNRTTGQSLLQEEVKKEQGSIIDMFLYEGQLHVLWEIDSVHVTYWQYEEYVYNVSYGSLRSVGQVNQALYQNMKNKGYTLIDAGGKIYTAGYCLQEFGQIYAENRDDAQIGIFDQEGNFCDIVEEVNGVEWVYEINDSYIIYESEEWDFTIYDRVTHTSKVLDVGSAYLGYEEGCIFYEKWELGADFFSGIETICRYDITTEQLIEVYQRTGKTGTLGMEYFLGNKNDFYIWDGKAYFISTNGRDVNWYVYDIENETVEPIESAESLWHYTYTDYGTVVADSRQAICPICKQECYAVYSERFVLGKRFPNAKKINDYLKELQQQELDSATEIEGEIVTQEDCWHFPDLTLQDKFSVYVEGVTEVGAHYLQVYYSGMHYGGGAAHGHPYRDYILFDLNTGEIVTFADLYRGNEKEFKQIVLEYTVKDWERGEQIYAAQTEEQVRKDAQKWISLDMTISFEQDGIVAVLPVYSMGSFADGFYEIEIPYEVLDMKEPMEK